MTVLTNKKFRFHLLAAAGLSLALFATPALAADKASDTATPASAMSKEEVEKIIHDYILNNAPLIMESVDQYQRTSIQQRSAEAVKTNFDELFKDDGAPFLGNPKGDVLIVEFFDFNCGYCKRVLPEIQSLVDADKNVKVIFKDFPILGPSSEVASKWALAAHKGGKYFAFHKLLMEHKGPIDDESLGKIAKEAGLDPAVVKRDAESSEILLQIEKNRALGGQVGVSGTPAFVIGDSLHPGAIPSDELKKLVAAERAKKGGKKD